MVLTVVDEGISARKQIRHGDVLVRMEGKSKGTIERYSGARRDGATITTAERRVYQFSQFGLGYL